MGVILSFTACRSGEYRKSTFTVFGTISNVTYESPGNIDLQHGIDSVLNRVNYSLSPFVEGSIVSQINRNESVLLDDYFIEVYLEAKRFSVLTSGAFDITVGPLVNEWGFGTEKDHTLKDHNSARIDSIMHYVGFEKVGLMRDSIVKRHPEMKLDFSSVAKGYAVDKVGEYLASKGCKNYLVDIGGEVQTKGYSPSGKEWRVGVSKPIEQNFDDSEVQEILSISNKALATSGNYRNFYIQDGVKYAHTIDPRTGYPVQSRLLSATVLAESCMEADAASTACMVLGLEKSIEFIEMLAGVEAYFVYSEGTDYAVYYTDGFRKYIQR